MSILLDRVAIELQASAAATKDKRIADQVFSNYQKLGLLNDMECVQIALASLKYLGLAYLRTRELRSDTIDCSTLISQAHWEGALVQIPFTAERQRTGSAGQAIQISDVVPGDIFIQYASVDESPDKDHNHVAMYMGVDTENIHWLIESKSGEPVRFCRADEFETNGGIRRYTQNPMNEFLRPSPDHMFEVARSIPKAGRIGAPRSGYFGTQSRLPGVNATVAVDEKVRAPFDGNWSAHSEYGLSGVRIVSEFGDRYMTILNVGIELSEGPKIEAGKLVGTPLPSESALEECINRYIYVEFGSKTALQFRLQHDGSAPMSNFEKKGDWCCYNFVYPMKLGLLRSPLSSWSDYFITV